jgi:hypothetical protein
MQILLYHGESTLSSICVSYELLSSFDFNDDIGGGTSFEDTHQNWHEEAIFQDFSDWVLESFGKFYSTASITY